jgi:hypothetical protein
MKRHDMKSTPALLLLPCLVLCLAVLGRTGRSMAATVDAASCSRADVQAAIDGASPGDTVRIPAGTCTWEETDHVSITRQLSVIGAGTTTGENLTKIIHDFVDDDSSETPATFNIRITSDVPVRISGIYFDKGSNVGGSAYPNLYRKAIHISGSTTGSFALTQIRIDHNYFRLGKNAIFSTGHVCGVIDSNTFLNPDVGIFIVGDNGHAWDRPLSAGTSDALFIENNTFLLNADYGDGQSDEMIYPQEGGRPVVRYNTYDATAYTRTDTPQLCTSHPNWGGTAPYWEDYRGQPIYEIYNNTVSLTSSYNRMLGGNIRGGSVLIHDNTIIKADPGSEECPVGFTDEEGWTTGGLWCPDCPVITTWPANDQVTNSFVWANTMNGESNDSVSLPNTTSNGDGYDDVIIQQDRDYFLHAPEASGGRTLYVTDAECTAGGAPAPCCTGSGTGNCAPGHFDAMIFTSSGPNAYYPYTPYTYPHPFRTDCGRYPTLCDGPPGDARPSAPTALSVS